MYFESRMWAHRLSYLLCTLNTNVTLAVGHDVSSDSYTFDLPVKAQPSPRPRASLGLQRAVMKPSLDHYGGSVTRDESDCKHLHAGRDMGCKT